MSQEFKVVGKMDLDKLPKKGETRFDTSAALKKYEQPLNDAMAKMATEINEQYGYVLDSNAKIDWLDDAYDFTDKARDRAQVFDCEAYFMREAGKDINQPGELEAWRKEHESTIGVLNEKVIALVLHRILGEDFLVVRTSDYDDYTSKVDNLIIDKKTGVVICGFDYVLGEGANSAGKQIKIQKIVDKGGANIRYGLGISDISLGGKLHRQSLKNTPAFYLAMSKKDLADVLPTLDKAEPSIKELTIVKNLVASLEQQVVDFYGADKINNYSFEVKKLLTNVKAFANSLNRIKDIVNQKIYE